ncbi:MAG: hypothetical protein KF729_07525 [Sandaracinaceae bacterium]|nr:hypothetical protein [Sandaracinaceae bacterium]
MRRFVSSALSITLSLALCCACDGPSDDRPRGDADAAAMASCTAAGGAPQALVAASSAASAGDAVIELPAIVGAANPYRVTLPAGAAGYAVLRTPVEHVDAALFVSERDRITHLAPDGIASSLRHGVCPDTLIDDYRAHIHEPRDYVLTFAADGPRELVLVAVLADQGHPEGDGGHHHEEDGGHHHEEDGGHHHEEDGGHHHEDGGTCAPGGASCTMNSDCCSNDCDVDHCH